jgi:membrane protein implicated in regulation of membrane protease activity
MMDTLIELLKPELIWFIAGLVMLLLEFAMPSLIIFFFGIGAWIVALLCLFTDISLNMQLTIFLFASIFLVLSLRKWLKNVFVGRKSTKQDPDELQKEFVGEKAIVKKQISPGTIGKVEFHGTNWNAESDETIPEGTSVEVIGNNNITLKVKPVQRG